MDAVVFGVGIMLVLAAAVQMMAAVRRRRLTL